MEASSTTSDELFTVAQGREFGPFSEQRWRPDWSDGVNNMKPEMGDGGGSKFGPPPGFRANNEVLSGGVSSAFHFSKPDVNEFLGNARLDNLLDEKLNVSSPSLPDQLDNDADELLGSIEDAIGKLLPNDEDELLADAGVHLGRASSLEDDFDIFNSGGGMELDGDSQNGYLNGLVGGNGATPAGEHPYGEHPSRTLFVRNINSNVEDMELRTLFEEYGDIRTLYTACKHRGFVMVSYYDIRAARIALRALNGKLLRRRKLDIHYSIPKDNPSDKDVNQGTLVVFNLDSSVSNEELRQKFGVYGEIKEIRETPHKKHHKFIEFYDVRAADAALRALNRSDIAGKRIKLEPSRPGGARRSLMQQLSHELEEEELRCQQMPSSLGSGQWSNKHSENAAMRTGSPLSPSFNTFGGKPLNGLVGSLPARVSSPLRNSMTAAGHEPLLQSHLSLRIRQHVSPLFSEVDSPTYSTSFSPFDGLEATQHLQRGGLGGDISGFEHSPRALLGASKSHNIWSNYHQMAGSPPVMYGEHASSHFQGPRDFASNMHGPVSDFVEGHNGYLPEQLADKWPASLAALRLNGSNGSHLLATSHGGAFNKGVMIDSPRLGVMSPQHRPRSFPNGGLLDGFNERGRSSPRADTTSTQYQLDLDRILRGEDLRTTLMIKNIPNKYTSKMLLATIDEHHRGTYDFIYLPIDFKNKCNVGYAFINMIEPSHIIPFYKTFNGKKWEKFNSEKVASLAYARIQGKSALIAHFQNSSLMNEDKRCRPILFHSEGPNLGDPEPFPVGSNVRTRPGRERNGLSHHYDSSSVISSSLSSCSSKEDENGEPGHGSSDNENN